MKKEIELHRTKKKSDAYGDSKVNEAFPPVVGIGASAGGLEALEIFLKNIPTPNGIAIVIVQHLDPTRNGILVELLQRTTNLPVVQVTDNLKVAPNHVYVIPPNKDMSMLRGTLHLFAMVKPRGLRLPIDFFFHSMADDLQQRAIGVVLSGMGSDGTVGLRYIKDKGGAVFVQEPGSAKFDGMPRSAIDTGLADVIAPVEELPQRIMTYLQCRSFVSEQIITIESKTLSSLEKVIILLRAQTGHDFSLYKKNTIYRRIERRMGILQLKKIADYVSFLQENSGEIELLFKELLIGVTSFFRDPIAWEALKTKAITSLFTIYPSGGCIRAWVAGCSTGEEAYSLAILFREVVESVQPAGNFRLQIFATDLDKDAIDKARSGIYRANIEADLSSQRMDRYFEKEDQGYRILREIRETIVFAPHNVIMDPPFTKLDLLVCRNLLIYMEPELQKKLLPLFHYSLNPGGILFLGSAESLSSNAYLFEPIDINTRIYRKLQQGGRPVPIELPASFTQNPLAVRGISDTSLNLKANELNLQLMTDKLLLQHYTPAAVLTDSKGDIIYISGRTGKYLEPAAGKVNWNVFAMAREGLRYELSVLFSNVLRQKGVLTKKGVIVSTEGGTQKVDITLSLLEKPALLRGLVLIIFADIAKSAQPDISTNVLPAVTFGSDLLVSLEQELKQARSEIITIREEMQTSQEELRSTNEEMQSSNEELQSTNEELTTSKEEMQSLNEELQTVNHELQSKVSDLSLASNDMKNLLNSTEIATLFLDESLNIRRFTTQTATIIKLITSDIGRPITDIVSNLNYPDLADDSRKVLHSLAFSEKQIFASDGRWFTVKIMPYRTQENKIDGLVITFTDITASKKFEQNLTMINENYNFLFEAIPFGCMLQDTEGRIIMANHEAQRILGFSTQEIQGKKTAELRWKTLRENGSVLPSEEYPAMVALHSGNVVSNVVIGIVQLPAETCRWVRVTALPRFRPDSAVPYQVYTFLIEIPELQKGV